MLVNGNLLFTSGYSIITDGLTSTDDVILTNNSRVIGLIDP